MPLAHSRLCILNGISRADGVGVGGSFGAVDEAERGLQPSGLRAGAVDGVAMSSNKARGRREAHVRHACRSTPTVRG